MMMATIVRLFSMKIIAVLTLLIAMPLSAQTLRFLAEELPTFHFNDNNGIAKGALVDIVNEVAKEANLNVVIEIVPFARAYHSLQNNANVLMFSLLKSPKREANFKWIGETYHNSAFLVGLVQQPIKLTTLADAKSYIIGTIRGYHSESYLRDAGFNEQQNLSLSVKYDHLWHKLFQKRVDLVLTNTIALARELSETGLDATQVVRYLELKDFPDKLYIAGNKNLENNIANALSKALIKIKENGTYERILQKWQLTP